MISKTLIFDPNLILHLCTVCVTDNNGGKIALSIIILSFILLAAANWGWKKYFSNKNEVSQEK